MNENKNIMKGYQCCNKVAANFQKKSRNGNEKKYLREFDALEMLLETVAKFGNKMSKCSTTFSPNWQ